MALKFMKGLKVQTPPKDSLKAMLHDHLSGFEPHRGVKRIHASELTKEGGFCPRFYALADKMPKVLKDGWLTTSERVTYQIGRDMQDNIVNWFADMDRAVGDWRCRACDKLHWFQRRPAKCEGCGCKTFAPQEVRFESLKSGASCGIDMLVKLSGPKLVPVEIKTMDKEQFKDLKGPLAEHRLRSNLYLRLIDESDGHEDIDTSRIIVLYTTKGGYGTADAAIDLDDKFSPFKEYEVTRDDSQTDALVLRAQVVTDYRAGKIGMPMGICSTALVPRAKKCSACQLCFSGDHPPEHDWKT